MDKILNKMEEAGEDTFFAKTLLSELKNSGVRVIGAGHEKKYNRKTIIFEVEGKWKHWYGDTYIKCIRKQIKRIRKRKKGVVEWKKKWRDTDIQKKIYTQKIKEKGR